MTYRVDIRRRHSEAVYSTEEFLATTARGDVRDVLSEVESRLDPGDTFQLFVITDDGDAPGLLRLV